jgi:hypothetical protein
MDRPESRRVLNDVLRSGETLVICKLEASPKRLPPKRFGRQIDPSPVREAGITPG